MRKFSVTFCSLALLAANSCAMAGIFTIFSIVDGLDKVDPGLAVWLVCLSLCCVGLEIFLRRSRSVRSIIIFCAAFFALQLVLVLCIYGFFSGTISMLSAVCMWLYSYYSCYELALEPVTAEKITKSFDMCNLVLVFALFFCSVKAVPIKMLLPMAVSTLLCLIALVISRSGTERRVSSVLFSSGIILAFAALSAVLVAFASGGVRKVLAFASDAVSALIGLVLRAIDAVFKFLAGLFPDRQYESLAPVPTEPVLQGDIPDVSFELVDPEKLIIAMIAAGLCLVAVIIIYRLVRGKGLNAPRRYGGEQSVHRERRGLAVMLRRGISRLLARIAFAVSAFSARSTAPGLFWQIERRSRTKLHGRGRSESCREFLKRAETAYPHAALELQRLADAMDAQYFGGRSTLGASEIAKMRKSIFKTED